MREVGSRGFACRLEVEAEAELELAFLCALGGGGGEGSEGAGVETFGGDGGGVLKDEGGDAVDRGADEEGAFGDGGVVDAVGEVEGFDEGVEVEVFAEGKIAGEAEVEVEAIGEAEGVAANGGKVEISAGAVDALVAARETGAAEDVVGVRTAAGLGEERGDEPAAGEVLEEG